MKPDQCDLLCLDLPQAEKIKNALPATGSLEHASAAAQALSDPTRMRLAVALSLANEACVCDLAWISGRAQNLVSHHLRTLRVAGLVTAERRGKMVVNSLTKSGRMLVKSVLAVDDAVAVGS
ncbi:MAG: winged helix-turn-helix transcriptional regulator [Actinobacteria bacterium]|nr:winged helix-turn-helix transcriptional regulator [Actinomycetota bacterium]